MSEKIINVTIPIPESIFRIFEDRAKIAQKNLEDYLLEEVFIATNLQFYFCPKCKRPVADMRYIDYERILLTCHFCGHEWEAHEE